MPYSLHRTAKRGSVTSRTAATLTAEEAERFLRSAHRRGEDAVIYRESASGTREDGCTIGECFLLHGERRTWWLDTNGLYSPAGEVAP